MQQQVKLKLSPSDAESYDRMKANISEQLHVPLDSIRGVTITRKSIDARSKQPWVIITAVAFIDEPFFNTPFEKLELKNVSQAKRQVIIIGSGPAGLFAAIKLIEHGIRPVILERGKDVRARRRDLAELNKNGILNPESNYCFGEGGAGTYSDGKLYTRSTKRGDVTRILRLFVQFGAEEKILYESHPHIGTNKLPHIITSIRNAIIELGGQVLFEQKVVDFIVEKNVATGVQSESGAIFTADSIILATGHSARDIFVLLNRKKIAIESKSFALGVRVEHPQNLIDSIQYHTTSRGDFLPPASYNLVQQVDDKGVFSFCMCPGGIIAPASTSGGELVVNGWSPSKRNNPFANSGIVVAVSEKDVQQFIRSNEFSGASASNESSLHGMYFQEAVERTAFQHGGGNFVAPAQRMIDFVEKKSSTTLPPCSYVPGVNSAMMNEVLPAFVFKALKTAFRAFDEKMKGYFTNEAIVVATESRTSSPVRIPRNESLQHPAIKSLYPCGEGAGYAGGIVSAAMDGERVAQQIIDHFD